MARAIEHLAKRVGALAPEDSLADALLRMEDDRSLNALPVAFEGALVGLVMRTRLESVARSVPTPDVLSATPVTRIMSPDPVMIEAGASLRKAAHTVLAAGRAPVSPVMILVAHGRYIGLVELGDLLAALADQAGRASVSARGAHQRADQLLHTLSGAEAHHHRQLAVIGHELRTPLNAMLGLADEIAAANGSISDLRERADALTQACESLDALLRRLIDAGRLGEEAVVDISAFATRPLAEQLAALWRMRAQAAGLELKITVDRSVPDTVAGDLVRVRQILDNLISNAVKYADAGGLDVRFIALSGAAGPALQVEVADDGPGIDLTRRESVFEAYRRGGDAEGAVEGTGLGLHLARNLARSLGGDLAYQARQEGGSLFRLTLPVRVVTQTEKPHTPRIRRRSFELSRILLVEDHAPSRDIAIRALEQAGWQVETADTLQEMSEQLKRTTFQAIVADVHLPDGDTCELLRGWSASPSGSVLPPLLALTADISQTRRDICLRAGFSDVIAKPLRGRELVTALADMIVETLPQQARRA